MPEQKATVGRIVHYVSHGTPPRADATQAYTSECRAAIVTDAQPGLLPDAHVYSGQELDTDNHVVGLCVLNPTGVFFLQVPHNEETNAAGMHQGGTWHWPERA